jgi:zinc protease
MPSSSGRSLWRLIRFVLALGAALFAMPALAVLPIESWTTASGTRVLFVRADAIPMLDLQIDFDAGGRLAAPERLGLASMVNAMLAKGAGELDEAAIAEGFALTGAGRGGGAGDDSASVSLRSLTSEPQLSRAVELLALLLSKPTFPQSVLEREKARVIASLRESATRPETLVRRNFGSLLYGDHPYGRYAEPETVAAIGRDDLVRFHAAHYSARRAVISMIGAVTRERAAAIADELTRGLPAGTDPLPLARLPAAPDRAERRIEHPASQSHVLVGQRGIARGDPDFFALTVGNYVLGGGGFVSRLYGEVREKRGLAYSVSSYFSPQIQPGPFAIGLQTRKDQADQALGVVREVLERFVREGPTDEELAAAKSNLIGGFALRIDSNGKILAQLSAIGFYGLPLDWLERWTDRVAAVTLADVRAAFQRHIRPEAMVTVVVGAPPAGASAR